MRPFTPWRGVDSPSKGEVSPCLRFWFLNPSVCQVCLHCIVYHVTSYSWLAFFLRNHLFYPLYFLLLFWETSAGIIWGWQKKHIRLLLFYIGNFDIFSLMTDLILPHMLGLVLFLYRWSMFLLFFIKKKMGEKMHNFIFFIFDRFSDIACIFTWYLSSLCIDWLCLDMIKSLCLIFAKFLCTS